MKLLIVPILCRLEPSCWQLASNANRPPACLAFHPPSDLPSSRSSLQQHGNAYPPRSVLRLVTRREGLSRQGTSMTSMNIAPEACTQELLLVLTPVIRTACSACRMSVTVLIESTDRVCGAASLAFVACLLALPRRGRYGSELVRLSSDQRCRGSNLSGMVHDESRSVSACS